MRKEIDRVLGNSLRCILPSYWWKRLLGKMSDRIDSVESSASSAMKMATLAGLEASDKQDRLVSGSNIKTINHQSILGSGNIIVDTDKVEKYKTKEDLDANGSLAGGDIAAVVDALLVEKSFTECYQPTRSEIETDPYNKKFTKVDSISLNLDFNPNLISSNYGSLRVVLYSDGNSKGYYEKYPRHLDIVCNSDRTIFYYEYPDTTSIGTGHRLYDSSGFNASNIDIVNNILREGDFRFSYFEVTYREDVNVNSYTYYYSYNENFPSDAIAMIDNVVKMLFVETQNADIYVRSAAWVKLLKEGDVTGGGADITIDSELSDISENPVQNKVVKAYVDTEVAKKVDKVSGKGLSTEDFTTLLKTKLEGLENYDDTTLTNAISSLETRLNTLVSGDTSTAIESFNEVIAFLENLTDTQDLSSIIASIEQQINAKQDKINDLEDIRSGASLGKTSLQEHQDISHLATKEEVQNVVDDILENEEVYAAAVNDLNTRIVNTENSVSSEINNRESLQTEFQNFKTQVTDNEEVWATSLTDINTRIDNNYQYGEDTYTTKESLNTEIQTINTTILDNEEVIAATLTNLNNQIASLNALITDLTNRIETLENA